MAETSSGVLRRRARWRSWSPSTTLAWGKAERSRPSADALRASVATVRAVAAPVTPFNTSTRFAGLNVYP